MGGLHCRHHHFQHTPSCFSFATIATLTFLLLTSVVSALRLNNPTRRLCGEQREVIERVVIQRRLSGPGSSPPTCRSKCGRCLPCKPVRVSIQPGFSVTLEYYPEAWRCKCGNNLFMP